MKSIFHVFMVVVVTLIVAPNGVVAQEVKCPCFTVTEINELYDTGWPFSDRTCSDDGPFDASTSSSTAMWTHPPSPANSPSINVHYETVYLR